jgi:hypothetical protein
VCGWQSAGLNEVMNACSSQRDVTIVLTHVHAQSLQTPPTPDSFLEAIGDGSVCIGLQLSVMLPNLEVGGSNP